jgi:hypothetical protein
MTWQAAEQFAQTQSYLKRQGYLVTLDTPYESNMMLEAYGTTEILYAGASVDESGMK